MTIAEQDKMNFWTLFGSEIKKLAQVMNFSKGGEGLKSSMRGLERLKIP